MDQKTLFAIKNYLQARVKSLEAGAISNPKLYSSDYMQGCYSEAKAALEALSAFETVVKDLFANKD